MTGNVKFKKYAYCPNCGEFVEKMRMPGTNALVCPRHANNGFDEGYAMYKGGVSLPQNIGAE